MIKNIIIFGKNGQVANDLLKIFSKQEQFKITNYSSKDIDFSDLDAVKKFLPSLPKCDLIINATAHNQVDRAEDEKELAENINHKSVSLIAKYCKKNDVRLIHYSTNYVFDGKRKSAYKENNIENLKPLSIYGKSKLNGEKAIIKSDCDYLILRVASVYNLNFENNFVVKIRKLAIKNKELKIVNDQICNPINSYDIAENTIKIIEKLSKKPKFKQIYHLVSKKPISYYDFAKKIASDIDDLKITHVTTEYFPTRAKRPLNGALNCSKLKKDFNIEIQSNYKDVTIILVAYNSSHIISNALKNIVGKGYRIVIVDNGSKDNLEQYLQDNFKGSGIKLISLENNIGFGRANNLVLESVATNYAFLLNPDAIITEKSLDNLVIEAEKDERIAISSPLVTKNINPKKTEIDNYLNEYRNKFKICSENDNIIETDFICGGYMMLNLRNFKDKNFFDDSLFLYGEDFELSKRKFAENYKNIIVKNAFVYHQEHSSTKIENKSQKYKMLFFRHWHMGWGKSYLERRRKPYYKLWLKSMQKLLSSIQKIIYLDPINFIKYFATFCGMLSNLLGINCFNDGNKNSKIKSEIDI